MKQTDFQLHLTNNIIPFWNRLKDTENGGFYGLVSHDNIIDPKGEKGVILNSRILWFYSAAYKLLGDPELLEMADHAYAFLRDYCWDSRYGGLFWSLNYDGTPCDDMKHTYNQSFAIYALSVYNQASGSTEALELAAKIYDIIEEKCRDGEGYLEGFARDFSPSSNEHLSENGVMADRTMNTLLHVMEAYTELYRSQPTEKVANSLRWILSLFKDKMYSAEKQILEVFFDMDYNTLIDLESYGHDIEAAWLIDRACEVLADDEYTAMMRPITEALAEAVFRNAIDENQRAVNNERENDKVDTRKVWWVQAESIVGFWNAYQKDPSKEEYRQLVKDIWSFIQNFVVDKNSGEWIEMIQADGQPVPELALVQPWKCPYHNGRMCIEMVRRLA